MIEDLILHITQPTRQKEEKMKTKMKIASLFLLTGILLLVYALPTFAMEPAPRLTNIDSAITTFGVVNNIAEVTVDYIGRADNFSRAEVSVKVEKKFLLLFWKDVAEWTSSSTDVNGFIVGTCTADGSGTYRATITLTIYGKNGVNDVIEDVIETKAG